MTDCETVLWFGRGGNPRGVLALAHGAGVGMDSPFMEAIASRLSARGVAVARFEFAYMAARRAGGGRRPPPAAERLVAEYVAMARAVAEEAAEGVPFLIGGKSLGGRVAALASADAGLAGRVAGLVCLGYPFHAPGKPEALRLAPLADATVPALVCQGERDPFGTAKEAESYGLPRSVSIHVLDDGDHDFKPRGRAAATWKGNLDAAAEAVAAFAGRLGG